MKNRWDEKAARAYGDDLLALRAYSSRLLGSEPDLVLHGGGNTSVKTERRNLWGDTEPALCIKGSGHDLATIDSAGFVALRLEALTRLAAMDDVDDRDLVRLHQAAAIDPGAPNASLEAVVHACIPFTFVDHTHADAVVTITNTPDGETRIRELYGDRVVVVPYVKPGLLLAKAVQRLVADKDWRRMEALILLNHGIITFADDARTSYQRMIALASEAEALLAERGGPISEVRSAEPVDLEALTRLRREVSRHRQGAVIAKLDDSPTAVGFSLAPKLRSLAERGPLTPDHVSRTRQAPVILSEDWASDITRFCASYQDYVRRHGHTEVIDDATPRWAIWPGAGVVAFGRGPAETGVVLDIVGHTMRAIQQAESIGGWKPVDEEHFYDVEYWPPQMAKFAATPALLEFAGKVALVTGAASGIGRACARELADRGASVVGLDIDPAIAAEDHPGRLGLVCDVTDEPAVTGAIREAVRRFGGLDIVVSNAGIFPASETLERMQRETWNRSLSVNLTSVRSVIQAAIPFLRNGIDPALVVVASKNVLAPGKGAAAYSVAKAGLTQLARIAALEFAESGVRVNIAHPDNVFDTGIWTPEVLEKRAAHHGLTVDQYRRRSLLGVEVRAADVARLVCAMAGSAFRCTTGAQVPIDGGSDRVI